MTILTFNHTVSVPRASLVPYLPLDLFPDALLAHSTRALSADWSGALIRVRATDGTTDQGQADVLPSPNDIRGFYGLDSPIINLDATAIARGLTPGVSTLGNLVATGGANYSGYCPVVYNQGTAFGAHQRQSVAAYQPRAVNAGVLQFDPIKTMIPVLKYDGVDDYMSVDGFSLYPNESSYFGTANYVSGGGHLATGGIVVGGGPNYIKNIIALSSAPGNPPVSSASLLATNSDGQASEVSTTVSRPGAQMSMIRAHRTAGTITVGANAGTATTTSISGAQTINPAIQRRMAGYKVGAQLFNGAYYYFTSMYVVDSIWIPYAINARDSEMVAAINSDIGLF